MRLSILLLLVPVLPAVARSQTTGMPSETAGTELARSVVQAMGGLDAWNDRSWDLAFDFVVAVDGKETSRYSHVWHRAEDGYEVSGRNREGRPWRVVFTSLSRREAVATFDGGPPPDSLRARLLDVGYGRFINDTYWLLMPSKLLDSGVRRERLSDTTIDGKAYRVLALSFAGVGLTPGDRYRLYIDPTTMHVSRWRYLLESGREAEFVWDEYTRFEKVVMSLRKRSIDGHTEIRFENVAVRKR